MRKTRLRMGSDQRIAGCLLLLLFAGCSQPLSDKPVKTPSRSLPPNVSNAATPVTEHKLAFPSFQNVTKETGVEFTYLNGATGQVLMVEAIGGGVGWIDYDSDGLQDLYFCQGGNPVAAPGMPQPTDQIFRQIEPGGFRSVAEGAFVDEQRYSQGVSVADFDDDGFDDILVTNVGPDTFLRNCGDGTFVEIGSAARVDNPYWGTSSAWSDLDGDGDLDFYLCNYVDYDPRHPVSCLDKITGQPGTCTPQMMKPGSRRVLYQSGRWNVFTGRRGSRAACRR